MKTHQFLITSLLSMCLLSAALGVGAQTVIDHSKAINGTVVAGDAPEYPVTLTQPGHYKLTSDLWVPTGKAGIIVGSDNVTIDLNGYTIRSRAQCARYMGTHDKVTCYADGVLVVQDQAHGISTNRNDTVVRNGRIKGFTGHGVWASGAIKLTDLSLVSNAGSGAVFGHESSQSGRVLGVAAEMNAVDGMQAKNALIERSVFTNNGRHGLQATRTAVLHSAMRQNSGRGVDALTPTTLSGSTMFDNSGGAMAGPVMSLGGNFDGVSLF